MDPTTASWVVTAVATTAVAALTYLTRRFVERTEDAINKLVAQGAETEKRLALGNAAFQHLSDLVRAHTEAIRQLEKGHHALSERLILLEEKTP